MRRVADVLADLPHDGDDLMVKELLQHSRL